MNRTYRMVAALLFLLWLAAGAAAQAAEVAVANGFTSVVTLTVPTSAKNRLRGELYVRVYDASGKAQAVPLVYLLSSSGQRLQVLNTITGPGTNVSRKAGPGSKTLSDVTLVFDAPEGTAMTDLAGLLSVADQSLPGSPLLPVTFSMSEPAVDTVSPAKVTYSVTLWAPWAATNTLGWRWLATLPLNSLLHINEKSAIPKEPVYLSSDSGDRMGISLHRLQKKNDYTVQAILSEITAAGMYTGEYLFQPGVPTSPKVDITVKVQHLFIYPLAVIALGCLLAWCMLRRRELERPKELLRAQIRAIDKKYKTESGEISSMLFYNYDDSFPVGLNPVYPTSSIDIDAESKMRFSEGLYEKVNGAKKTDHINSLALAIANFENCTDEWGKIQEIYAGLSAQKIETLQNLHGILTPQNGGYPIQFAIDNLLKSPSSSPVQVVSTYATSLTDLKENLKDADMKLNYLSRGLDLYMKAQKKYVRVCNSLTLEEKKDLDPRAAFAVGFRNTTNNEDFADAVKNLGRIEAGLSEKMGGVQTLIANHGDESEQQPFMIQAHDPVVFGDARSPEAILKSVSILDNVDLLISLLISILVYFVSIYSKGTFGAWYEYLAAFLTGAAGTFLVKGASLATILPWQQTMKVTPAK